MKLRHCAIALFFVVVPIMASAGAVLTVQGQGSVSVRPDTATITVGVEVKSPTADRALRANSARMRAVFAVLKTHGIAEKDIQTRQFSLNPVWKNQLSSYDKPLEISGYSVSNVIVVRIRQLDRLGVVLDVLTKNGANRIESVQFGVLNSAPYTDQARTQAVQEALRKAAIYAQASGLSVGSILSIDEGGARGAAPLQAMMARASASDVPIAQGELTLDVRVTIRLNLE